MPFMTETPKSETKPIAAEMLKCLAGDCTGAMMPPATANGMPASASRLSREELNRP